MGEFDINPNAAPASERRKILFMTILVLILGGVLAFHFLGHTPAPAVAAAEPGDASTGADDTPAKVRDALKNDPTAHMLEPTTRNDDALDTIPRNPFRMSGALRANLIRTADPSPDPTPVSTHVKAQNPVQPPAARPAVRAEDFKLTSIMLQNDRLYAIINGSVVSNGNTVGDARIIDVKQNSVLLQHADYPDGPTTRLMLDSSRKP